MHVIQHSTRIYTTLFLCLCAAVLFAPSVANANDYWSVLEKRWIPADQTPNAVKEMLGHKVSRPSGSTLSAVPSSPSISKNATGGLSASTNQIIKTMGQPSGFSATSNYSVGSAKTALKSCVRSPACAGRALGAGAIIYEGIQAWKEVYDFVFDEQQQTVLVPSAEKAYENQGGLITVSGGNEFLHCSNISHNVGEVISCLETTRSNEGGSFLFDPVQLSPTRVEYKVNQNTGTPPAPWYYAKVVLITPTSFEESPANYNPVPAAELDQMIDDSYVPEVSDAPVVLLSGEPDTFTLGTPAPAELPSTTTTNTDSQGKTTTTVKNAAITYNILNNNTSSPSIESTITETTNTYDDTANLVGSMTSTTTNNPVQPDPVTPPNSGASADIELPPFCTYASIVCDWIGWTKEPLEDEEPDPDLTQLITDFEPDEDGFDLGIGSGSCPEPIQLNLAFIDKTVEVKYDPFCDFLGMIKPFVLAAAYLFAAYLYVGVLRRG